MKSAAALGCCLSLVLSVPAAAQVRNVDIKTSDGVVLKGSYSSPGKPGPAILLIHQCNMDRRAWDGLATDLVAAGFHVLTFDLRGMGATGGKLPPPPPPPPPAGGTGDANKPAPGAREPALPRILGEDTDAAYSFLLSQKDVDKSRMAAGGASCGATLAADLATRHREISTLVLLSGGATARARSLVADMPALAIFGAAAEGDDGGAAAVAVRAIVGASKNRNSVLKISPGREHGVPMFATNPDLKPALVKWLQGQLRLTQ
jgi:dienelactone hydrolase